MTTTEKPVKYEYERIPYLVAYQNTSGVRDVYGGVAELVVLESHLLRPKAPESSDAGAAPAATSDAGAAPAATSDAGAAPAATSDAGAAPAATSDAGAAPA